jgi:Fic-DOC domain mobile mystery protein B
MQLSKPILLSDIFIKNLHKRMFKEVWKWAGSYRKTEKNLGVDPKQITVQVRDLCADANHWIQNQTFSWDEIGIRFHHRLVVIHPFPNGNGRHSRLITDVLMNVHKQALFTWGGNAKDARARYLGALKAADHNQFAELLKFVRSTEV